MAVKIRLTRTGSRNAPSFRVVAADTRFPRDGRFLENLGWYDPKLKGTTFKLKTDRIDYWRSKGARLSQTVADLLKRNGEAPVAEAAPPAPAKPAATPTPEPVAAEEEAPVAVDDTQAEEKAAD